MVADGFGISSETGRMASPSVSAPMLFKPVVPIPAPSGKQQNAYCDRRTNCGKEKSGREAVKERDLQNKRHCE
jgi:hypothetical protein